MNKVIKLSKKNICHNRTYKIISIDGLKSINTIKKIGLLEYKKGSQELFFNVHFFLYDFLKGALITKRLLRSLKYSGLLQTPLWVNNSINLKEKFN